MLWLGICSYLWALGSTQAIEQGPQVTSITKRESLMQVLSNMSHKLVISFLKVKASLVNLDSTMKHCPVPVLCLS